MAWHVLASSPFDVADFESKSKSDEKPEHLLPVIAERLGAPVHQPEPEKVTVLDRLGAVVYGQPQHWAQARSVYRQLHRGDAVFSVGCDAGVPLALLCGLGRKDVSFAIGFADPRRTRSRYLGWAVALLVKRLLVIVAIDQMATDVRHSFGRRAEDVFVLEGAIDCKFFRPSEGRTDNLKPLIVSCGAEQRDYVTMARALDGLEVDAKVCFASPNLSGKTRFTKPDPIPNWMEFRYFDFTALRDLYQRADVTVIPLLENRYSAGLTSFLEAVACGSPIVVTESPGIIQSFIDQGLVVGVPTGDEQALHTAVAKVLENPEAARSRADEARRHLIARYSSTRFLERLDQVLQEFARP